MNLRCANDLREIVTTCLLMVLAVCTAGGMPIGALSCGSRRNWCRWVWCRQSGCRIPSDMGMPFAWMRVRGNRAVVAGHVREAGESTPGAPVTPRCAMLGCALV